jgi:hypothetical protein
MQAYRGDSVPNCPDSGSAMLLFSSSLTELQQKINGLTFAWGT